MKQTFELTITSRDNHTWQGTLRTANGETIPFQSEMELLRALCRHLPPEMSGGAFQAISPCEA